MKFLFLWAAILTLLFAIKVQGDRITELEGVTAHHYEIIQELAAKYVINVKRRSVRIMVEKP